MPPFDPPPARLESVKSVEFTRLEGGWRCWCNQGFSVGRLMGTRCLEQELKFQINGFCPFPLCWVCLSLIVSCCAFGLTLFRTPTAALSQASLGLAGLGMGHRDFPIHWGLGASGESLLIANCCLPGMACDTQNRLIPRVLFTGPRSCWLECSLTSLPAPHL